MGVGSLKRAVFLDRDGVLNRAVVRDGKPYPPASVDEMEIPPGTREALLRLKGLDYLLVVVTNQPDVSRGKQTREAVEAIHARMGAELPIDVFRTCYHDDKEDCPCRKPKPGLLTQAAEDLGISLKDSFMVGDRWRDTEAGRAAGCLTIFIDYGYEQEGPNRPDMVARSLPEAVTQILSKL